LSLLIALEMVPSVVPRGAENGAIWLASQANEPAPICARAAESDTLDARNSGRRKPTTGRELCADSRPDASLCIATHARRNEIRPAGFEPATLGSEDCCALDVTTKYDAELGETRECEVPILVPSLSDYAPGADIPSDLADVVAAWPDLPDAIKAGVLALVRASTGNPHSERT
jgi:hypothetical protein